MIFKNWAFRLFIYTIIINICVAVLALYSKPVFDIKTGSVVPQDFTILGILADVTFVLGVVFLIVSIVKKESRDYKFYVASCGFGLFILAAIVLRFAMV